MGVLLNLTDDMITIGTHNKAINLKLIGCCFFWWAFIPLHARSCQDCSRTWLLLCLPPNETQMAQPLDVSFGSLNKHRCNVCHRYNAYNICGLCGIQFYLTFWFLPFLCASSNDKMLTSFQLFVNSHLIYIYVTVWAKTWHVRTQTQIHFIAPAYSYTK